MSNLRVTLIAFGALVVGAAGGYLFAKDRFSREFDERLEQEITAMENHFRKVEKRDEFSTAESALHTLRPELVDAAEALTNYRGAFRAESSDAPIKIKNIFTKPTVDVDWELELRNRTEDAPYVITAKEFEDNELTYNQITLVYFGGDNVLVDERDDVIETTDADLLVGLNNLTKFGLQSGDAHVVYVRNHVKELDIEVNLHEGDYAVHVLGLET